MNFRYLRMLLLMVFSALLSPQVYAWEERSSQSLSYPRFQVSGRAAEEIRKSKELEVPASDRPENSITAMPPKAREQFDRNEDRNRKRLEENRDGDGDHSRRRRYDHDHDHDNDNSRKHKDVPKSILDAGPFVAQAGVPESNRHKIIRDRDHHRHNRFHRHYRYNYGRRLYVYDPVTVVNYVETVPVTVVPAGYDSLNYGGVTYYYNDGQFYVPSNGEIVAVQPPVGAVVSSLPDWPIIIEGTEGTYYVYDGVFYRKVWSGYEVAVPPFGSNTDGALTSGNARDDVYVRLPDSDGGYAEVKLTRTSRGFKGPQGEYYSDFPPIEQLQEMYGDKG